MMKMKFTLGKLELEKNGEGVLFRVSEHLKDETYFIDVVILTTQNNSFGPTEISYLENRFTNLAKETDRFIVKNGNEPNPGNVTEEKESELEDFVEYSKMVLGVLGYKVFVPLVKNECNPKNEESEQRRLYLSRKIKRSNRTINAQCMCTSEGFVVLKGSMIEENDSKSIPNSIKALRVRCQANGDIISGLLQKNYLFNSPSYAAAFVLGMNTNGKVDWKTKDGITLKNLDENEL